MNFGTPFNPPTGLDIEKQTLQNRNYRKVLHTTPNMQLVVMSLLPREDIGMEAHPYTTQFLRVERGMGIAIIDDQRYSFSAGDVVIVPPGCYHNIINLSKQERLQLYALYSPPNHPIGTVQKTKPHND